MSKIAVPIQHLSNMTTWLRLLFMVLFGFLLYFLLHIAVFVTASVQLIFVLLTGKTNENMDKFATSLSSYTYQVIRYLMMTTEDKPFPFDRWPQS